MDSGNSGSMSSSGDEEYDSRGDIVPLPPFLNPHGQFGFFSHPHSSLVSSSHHPQTHHPSLFDVSPAYLQPNSSTPNPLLNLEAPNSQPPRSDQPNCTTPAVSSSSPSSLQLRSVSHDNINAPVRNPKKRTRASRRAPTTVLTTDTSNFRAMVQEFTGIPAPPFSSSSYSRRLDLLAATSSFRSSSSSSSSSSTAASHRPHLHTTTPSFYPLRPSPHKLLHPNPIPLLSSSPSPSPSSTLMLPNNMADAIASTTTTAGNSSPNSINYQLSPTDQVGVGVPYSHPQHMLSMQVLPFQTPTLHPFPNPPLPAGFNPKSQPSLSLPLLEDQLGMRHPHSHLVALTPHAHSHTHAHVTTSGSQAEGMPLGATQHDIGAPTPTTHAEAASRDHPLTPFPPFCKLNFSASSSSSTFNHDHNKNLDNTSTRGEGNNNVDSWICSSD